MKKMRVLMVALVTTRVKLLLLLLLRLLLLRLLRLLLLLLPLLLLLVVPHTHIANTATGLWKSIGEHETRPRPPA
jgi:hypothetical protein